MPPPVTNARILASAQVGFKRDIQKLFAGIVDDLHNIILKPGVDATGVVPESRLPSIQAATSKIISALFVGPDGRNAFAQDGVTPLSPYARLLNKWYVYVVVQQVIAQHKWMKKHLPPDVFSYLQTGKVRSIVVKEAENPFLRQRDESDAAYRTRLDALRIFQDNPLAQYEAMHTWADPNGYRLSDRIWRTEQETRQQMDALLTAGIRSGQSAVDLAAQMNAFLVPTQTGVRALSPYGGRFQPDGASYSAMRLARTEIAHANNQAAAISAQANPYVSGIDICRSGSGDPKCTICAQHATIDINGSRVRDPYPVNTRAIPPFHPHDLCRVQSFVSTSPTAVTQQFRGVMQDARALYLDPYMTPARANQFITDLVGPLLQPMVTQVLAGRA